MLVSSAKERLQGVCLTSGERTSLWFKECSKSKEENLAQSKLEVHAQPLKEQCLTGSDGCESLKGRQEILARKAVAKAGSPCQGRSVASDSLQLSELKP